MYRNKRYRIGSFVPPTRRQSNEASTNLSAITAISAATNPPATSTPVTIAEPAAGPSNILTERANVLPSQQTTSPKRQAIIANDDDFVPASQFVQPSRYTSQRSLRMKSQMMNVTQQTPLSYFESVLSRCGVELTARNCEISYTLNCDHLKFVNRLRKQLTSHTKYPENVQNFLNGLVDTMKTHTQLIKVLSGCMITLPNSNLSKTSQESLMNDFLMIDFMQKDIIEILMNKIKSLSVDDSNTGPMEIDLLLAQLKFVDHLEHGEFVCEQMFEILELATGDARQTIIKSLEDIVDLTRHNDVIEKLTQLLPDDADLLTEATIDTFGNMCLSETTHAMLCQKIIRYIKNNAPNSLLPCFTQFILKFSSQNVNVLTEVIESLRSCLRWPDELPTTRMAIHKNQHEVFACINRTLIRSKQLFDVWLKRIQANIEAYKPIDLIILLMMCHINDEKSNYIENIIRRKLKAEIIDIKLLEETVRVLPNILLEYSQVLFELLDTFVRDKNPLISGFASVGYRLIFGIESCDRKILLKRLVGFICERNAHSLNEANSGNKTASQIDITTSALTILTEINRKCPREMKYNGLQVLRLIDHSGDFSLSQFRLLMNIVCTIAYSEPPCEDLKDQIDMMVKKQVSSSIKNVKNRGIIGVVRVIDHMVWEPRDPNADEDDLNSSYGTIAELPTKLVKVAATYIDLAITSAQSSPEQLALFFDELASVFVERNIERKDRQVNLPFLIWLCNLITGYFLSNFIVEEVPAGSAMLNLQLMRALNTDSELEHSNEDGVRESGQQIAINIAGAVLDSSSNSLCSITILAPLFNLLRLLYVQRYNGSLDSINAILGAGVILPECISAESGEDIFDEFDEETGRKIIDMYFYTINQWRECISAYVTQNDAGMRKKVLTRLSEVIELEHRVKQLLATTPDDYVPPKCQFLTASATRNSLVRFKRPIGVPKKNPAKRKKVAKSQVTRTQNAANETAADITIPATARAATSKRFVLSNDLSEFLRYMDANIIQLFDENLILKYPLPEEHVGTKLGLLEFKFLMEDLTMKVESIYGVRKFGPNPDYVQSIQFSENFISDVVQLLPKIMAFFNQVANQMKIIIDAATKTDLSDSDTDTETFTDDLFSDEANLIKFCFGLCLRLLAALFTWPGFNDNSDHRLLKDALNAITSDAPYKRGNAIIEEYALAGIKNINHNSNIVMDLHSAVYMFHLTQTLIKQLSSRNAYAEHVVPLCKELLSRKWHSFDGRNMQGGECNSLLEQLLKGYFKNSKFSSIQNNIQWIQAEIPELTAKTGTLKTFPCFKLTNFPVLYREVYSSLIDAMHRKLDKNAASSNQLKIWENSCALIKHLLEIAKSVDQSRVFYFYLKFTHAYLKLFLQHGMSMVECSLRRNVERVSDFLHSLQDSTRFLHSLCCHSKAIKNASIIPLIPPFRQTLTQLGYQVKAALAANKCSSVFWMGNLKNKDIYGDEILSQTTSITRSSVSGDNRNDDVAVTSDIDGSASGSKKRSSAKPRKRKLRSINLSEDEDEEAAEVSSNSNSSRSRCF